MQYQAHNDVRLFYLLLSLSLNDDIFVMINELTLTNNYTVYALFRFPQFFPLLQHIDSIQINT